MKKLLIFTFVAIFNTNFGFSQSENFYPLIKENYRYDWSTFSKENRDAKEELIKQFPEHFELYNYGDNPIRDKLFADIHVLDFNGDGKDDLVFDGYSGGEPFIIRLYINNGSNFLEVFSVMQGISKMEFTNGKLSKLYIQDWGCCAAYLVENLTYEIAYNGTIPTFKLTYKSKHFRATQLPTKYNSDIKKVEIINDVYYIRLEPFIDSSLRIRGFDGQLIESNIVGSLSKGAVVSVLAEQYDGTGRKWLFVAIPSKVEIKNTLFYDTMEEGESVKLGWISSNFVKVIK